MKDDPTEKEMELAKHIGKLEGAASRPKITGGGLLTEALNFVSAHVPTRLTTAAIVIFLGYHAWDYFQRAQQMVAALEAKRAEAAAAIVEADAQNKRIGNDSMRLATLKAELEKVQADAEAAKADADAQNKRIGDGSMRLATLKAELEKTQAESVQAKAEADALNQIVDGIPLAVAQKKAEVETAEADANSLIQSFRMTLRVFQGQNLNGSDTMMGNWVQKFFRR